MGDWDADSPQLRTNLKGLIEHIRDAALRRDPVSVASVRDWHTSLMRGLDVPDPAMVGRFRGESGLEDCDVAVGGRLGVLARDVTRALAQFARRLEGGLRELDAAIPAESEPTADGVAAALTLCAWAHAEWVRIHPFANGNGRTARLIANSIAMRYGLPMLVPVRPRPGGEYGKAARAAMAGDWEPTEALFVELYLEAIRAGGA